MGRLKDISPRSKLTAVSPAFEGLVVVLVLVFCIVLIGLIMDA